MDKKRSPSYMLPTGDSRKLIRHIQAKIEGIGRKRYAMKMKTNGEQGYLLLYQTKLTLSQKL